MAVYSAVDERPLTIHSIFQDQRAIAARIQDLKHTSPALGGIDSDKRVGQEAGAESAGICTAWYNRVVMHIVNCGEAAPSHTSRR